MWQTQMMTVKEANKIQEIRVSNQDQGYLHGVWDNKSALLLLSKLIYWQPAILLLSSH